MSTKHIPEIRLVSVFQWWIEDIEGAINDIKNGKLPDIQPLTSVKSSIESCAPPLVKQTAERDGLKEGNKKLQVALKELLLETGGYHTRKSDHYNLKQGRFGIQDPDCLLCQAIINGQNVYKAAIAKADPPQSGADPKTGESE